MTSAVSMPAGHAIVASDFDAYENATGAWATWVPTLTNLTLGAATLVAKYKQVGKNIDYVFSFTFGAGSAVGTDPSFTLPVAPHADFTVAGLQHLYSGGVMVDSGTTTRPSAGIYTGGTVLLAYWNATPAVNQITSTGPWTWTTNDVLSLFGRYYIA